MLLMTDQDLDGSHISGLFINFIHSLWPSLLQKDAPFLELFVTPIVKARKASFATCEARLGAAKKTRAAAKEAVVAAERAVRRLESEEKTKGGIIIPDSAQEKPQEGEIIAVGSGARDESGKLVPLDVKAGDRILFGKWSGTEVKIDGQDLLIMKESDIMGVIAK